MKVDSDDGIKIWLNGEIVLSDGSTRGFDPDNEKVDINLKKGWNKFLVKVAQGGGGWGACIGFQTGSGKAISGLKSQSVLKKKSVAGKKLPVLLVGGRGHDWKGFYSVVAPLLEKTGGFKVTLTERLDDLKTQNLSTFKIVLFYGSGGDFSDPEQERGLDEFVKNGGGLAGVHATDAFKKSDLYWRLMGERFTTHGGGRFPIHIDDKTHPITSGQLDFEIEDESYQGTPHPATTRHSLARINREKEQQSMVWVDTYGKGHIFNTTLGHDAKSWNNPAFQRLLIRGLRWTAGLDGK